MALLIRSFAPDDFSDWLPLWDANNQGHSNMDVTATTWARLTDPAHVVKGLGAWIDGRLAGLVHYILHPVTGHIEPVCYMQDVFVDEQHRRRGVARALITALAEKGRASKWARMYWLAEKDNAAAQELYSVIGYNLPFTLHILPLTTESQPVQE